MTRKRRSYVYIYLTGGLGNQLFQYSYGKFLSSITGFELKIDYRLGKPRLNRELKPEIVDLIQDTSEFIENQFDNLFFSKITGFRLSNALNSKFNKLNFLNVNILNALSNLIMSFYFKNRVRIHASTDIGFSKDPVDKNKSIFAIGYYQSYKYVEKSEIKELVTNNFKGFISYDQFDLIANQVQPLVVHVRLGDYKKEGSFGILSDNYYSEAIEIAFQKYQYGEIWLFSDEITNAKDVIPQNFQHLVREFGDLSLSSSETLAIMSLGFGFIIANSTFSWWAAQLSKNPQIVIAPYPWFKVEKDPKDLIPESWKRLPAHCP